MGWINSPHTKLISSHPPRGLRAPFLCILMREKQQKSPAEGRAFSELVRACFLVSTPKRSSTPHKQKLIGQPDGVTLLLGHLSR